MAKFVVVLADTADGPLLPDRISDWANDWSSRFSDGLCALTPRIRLSGPNVAAILFDDRSDWCGIGDDYVFVGCPSREMALSGAAGAAVRFAPESVIARTDVVGSRSVWYGYRDGISVVSNSMRAVVGVLRRVELNRDALGWMLSAGNLGPRNSWIQGVTKLGPGSQLSIGERGVAIVTEVSSTSGGVPVTVDSLRAALREAVAPASEYGNIAVSLSGGIDSRILLAEVCRIKKKQVSAVTWGGSAAPDDRAGDVYIARQVSAIESVPHIFLPVDLSADADIGRVLRRFARISEGAVDWIAGYVDGFAALQWLSDAGLHRTVRGDQCFGSVPVVDGLHLRRLVHAEHTTDHPVLSRWREALPEVSLTSEYSQQNGESLSDWRDRLYRNVMIPYTLAPLAETKTSFVEQYTPFLHSSVVDLARSLPAALRDGKAFLTEFAAGCYPRIPFAMRPNLRTEVGWLMDARFGGWVDEHVAAAGSSFGLPSQFLADLGHMAAPRRAAKAVAYIQRSRALRTLVPVRLKRRARNVIGPTNAPKRRLALRLILAEMAIDTLREDARYSVSLRANGSR